MLLSMHKQMSTRPFGFITGAGIIKKLNLIHDVYRDPVFMEEVYVKFVACYNLFYLLQVT
jgi:hypothetical protein